MMEYTCVIIGEVWRRERGTEGRLDLIDPEAERSGRPRRDHDAEDKNGG